MSPKQVRNRDFPGLLDASAGFFRLPLRHKVIRRPVRMLGSKALEHVAAWFRDGIAVPARTFWGDSMTVVVPEALSCQILRYGIIEEDVTRFLVESLRPGDVFVDIGAHYGFFTALAARLVGPAGTVLAFEPVPDTWAVLARNVRRHAHVQPVCAAVFSTTGQIDMTYYGRGFSAYSSFTVPRLRQVYRAALEPHALAVRSVALDDWFGEARGPDMLKIDAESAELHVLQGAVHTLERWRPAICLEVGDCPDTAAAASRTVIDWLAGRGYTPWEYDGPRRPLRRHEPVHEYSPGNLLFLPADGTAVRRLRATGAAAHE